MPILYHIFEKLKPEIGSDFPKSLMIHSTIVKDKIRTGISNVLLLASTYKIFYEVHLCFPISGNIKNEFDGAFGCMRRQFKENKCVAPSSYEKMDS